MKKITLIVIALSFLLYNSAFALSIPWTFGEQNQFVDLSAERLIDVGDQNGLLEINDILRGIFDIDAITSPNVVDPLPNELTGIFEAVVTDRSLVGQATITWIGATNENNYGHAFGDSITTDLYKYTFGPSADFEATYGTGAMLAVYIDSDFDFVTTGTGLDIATAEGNVTDGTPYWTFGLGDTGEWIFDAGPEDISVFEYIQATSAPFASSQVAFNLIDNPTFANTGPDLVRDISFFNDSQQLVFVDLRANLDLFGIGDEITPFEAKNKVDGTLHPVPEPSTMLLLGAGLIGLAYVGRKKSRV